MTQKHTQLPQPTGPYTVGMTSHFLKDHARYYNKKLGRPLLIHVYYPSTATKKGYPPYLSDAMHLYKEKLARNHTPKDLAYLDTTTDWALRDAPIDIKSAPFPTLFFSPGFFMAAQLYSSLIEEMASHGYVVIAINHTDACWPVVFPDGSSPKILSELENIFSNNKQSCLQTFDTTQETWMRDIRYVLSWLHTQKTAMFDLSRLGIFGHSFGGSTATEATRQCNEFKAIANLDGMLFGKNWDKIFKTPSLFVVADQPLTVQKALSAGLTAEQFNDLQKRSSKKVFEQLQNHAFYVTVKDTDHASFVDSRIIKNPLTKKNTLPLSGITTTRALLVDFFDHYLKNKSLTLLDNQSPNSAITRK